MKTKELCANAIYEHYEELDDSSGNFPKMALANTVFFL